MNATSGQATLEARAEVSGGLRFSDGAREYGLGDLIGVGGPFGLDAASLAAALNVSEARWDNWVSGIELPPPFIVERLQRGVEANTADYVVLGTAWGGRNIVVPKRRWEPAFRPQSIFRLPLHVEWSGTADTRWRDARDPQSMDAAYELLIREGGVSDILRWVDPIRLAARSGPLIRAENPEEQRWPHIGYDRYREQPWLAHLEYLGYRG